MKNDDLDKVYNFSGLNMAALICSSGIIFRWDFLCLGAVDYLLEMRGWRQ